PADDTELTDVDRHLPARFKLICTSKYPFKAFLVPCVASFGGRVLQVNFLHRLGQVRSFDVFHTLMGKLLGIVEVGTVNYTWISKRFQASESVEQTAWTRFKNDPCLSVDLSDGRDDLFSNWPPLF